MLIGTSEQEVVSEDGDKTDQYSGALHPCEISRDPVCGACQTIPSKGEVKLLHPAHPVAKKEAQSLVGLLGFWGQQVPPLVGYSGYRLQSRMDMPIPFF